MSQLCILALLPIVRQTLGLDCTAERPCPIPNLPLDSLRHTPLPWGCDFESRLLRISHNSSVYEDRPGSFQL